MADVFNGVVGGGFNTTDGDARWVNESDFTKAVIDAMNIDADTLDSLDSLDFALSDGTRLRVFRSTSAPLSPGVGQLWGDSNTTPATLKYWTGSAWSTFTGGGGGGGATTLDDLTDVVITSPILDQLIRFDGTHFVNATVATGGGSGTVRYATLAKWGI